MRRICRAIRDFYGENTDRLQAIKRNMDLANVMVWRGDSIDEADVPVAATFLENIDSNIWPINFEDE